MPFFIIFILVPFLEIAVFMSVGEKIGLGTTLLLAFLTAIIGGALVRYQGLQTLFSLQTELSSGQMPVKEIFDGFCLIAAGALLITPGFITDAAGFSLLFPPVRDVLRIFLGRHFSWTVQKSSKPQEDSDIIEGDYRTLNDDDRIE